MKKNEVVLFDEPTLNVYTHRDSCNVNLFDFQGEVNDEISLTIPDEAMSMREILARHVRGLPITGGRMPIFDDDIDDDDPSMMPDLSRMDVTDRQATIAAYKDELAELQAKNKRRASNKASRDSSTSEQEDNAKRSDKADESESVERPSDD